MRRSRVRSLGLAALVTSLATLAFSFGLAPAQDRIDEITLRLHSPRPVTPRGIARLRVLLADGVGPMYRYGTGDLEGRLGAALAAL